MRKTGVIVILCIILCALSGCSNISSKDDFPQKDNDLQSIAEDNGLAELQTNFGKLYYPEKWSDMEVETKMLDNGEDINFSVTIDDQKYELFQINIGGGEGQLVGKITDSDGKQRDVFVVMSVLEKISDLPEETQDKLYAMQESVNTIVENLE